MTQSIEISVGDYGFSHNWTLVIADNKVNKSFFLGQDVKFCSRVLGVSSEDIIDAIGTAEIQTEAGSKKLAKFIVQHLGLTPSKIKRLQPWELCAQ